MLKKLFNSVIILCLTSGFSLSQKPTYTTSISTNRQIAPGSDPGNQIDEIYLLVEGRVKTVVDGDTIKVEAKDGTLYLIRMQGVDAPELKQEYGESSRKKLIDSILGKEVTVIVRKKDSSGNYIGTVYSGGQDINLKQIETGSAWHFKQKGYEQREEYQKFYERAELSARSERKGLWKDKNPVAPSDYRGEQPAKETDKTTPEEKPVEVTPTVSNNDAPAPKPAAGSNKSRTYIRGARGGCYYINSNGNKTYVDRSLCN